MFKIFALYSVVPVVVLLAVSFFVLLTARRVEKDQSLKVFGYVVVALLWLAALIVFSTGIYAYSRGHWALKCMGMGSGMMKEGMGQMKGRGSMPSMMPRAEKDSK